MRLQNKIQIKFHFQEKEAVLLRPIINIIVTALYTI